MRYIDTGEYLFLLEKAPGAVLNNIALMYGEAQYRQSDLPADFFISLQSQSLLRKYIRPQVSFLFSQHSPFKPMPAAQSFPVLEWGMNWCVAATDFNHLIIHAAVLVKNQKAIIFPALPGSGKSTLAAYLALNGWQLFSDEMAIIDLKQLMVKPVFRPICLKNRSIDLVKDWFPDAVFTTTVHDTQKGSVAHVKATDYRAYQNYQSTPIAAVVFPKYKEKSDLQAYALEKVEGFERLAANAFNYNILGLQGFEAITKIIETSNQFEIFYSDLKEVESLLIDGIIND